MQEDDIRVNQVYASALSCGYSGVSNTSWEKLARLVLESTYEATVLAAIYANNSVRNISVNLTTDSTSPHELFLTFLGGGVFRNDPEWIASSIGKALARVSINYPSNLHVYVCHYRRIHDDMRRLIDMAYNEELSRLG